MAFDGKGKYHMNPHHAKSADAQASKPGSEPQPGPDGMSGGKNGGKDLSAGIPTPKMPGAPEGLESPAHSALQSMAGSGGKHIMISKGDDGSLTTHHTTDTGEVEGPIEHADLEELKQHLESVLEEIADLLGSGASESQGASHVLGGY